MRGKSYPPQRLLHADVFPTLISGLDRKGRVDGPLSGRKRLPVGTSFADVSW